MLKSEISNFIMQRREVDIQKYRQYLTNKASDIVEKEILKINSCQIKKKDSKRERFSFIFNDGKHRVTSAITCSCLHKSRWLLPCKHIFKTRGYLKLNLFEEKLCDQRWTKKYHLEALQSMSSAKDVFAVKEYNMTDSYKEQTVHHCAQRCTENSDWDRWKKKKKNERYIPFIRPDVHKLRSTSIAEEEPGRDGSRTVSTQHGWNARDSSIVSTPRRATFVYSCNVNFQSKQTFPRNDPTDPCRRYPP